MTTQREEQNDEPKLSFVVLSDDNLTMHLNGESKYLVKLPINISKKNSADQMRIIKSKLLGGCDNYGLYYVSEDNIRNRAKEIVDQLHERPRVVKTVTVSDAIRIHEGKVITTGKIIGVSPPYKLISEMILRCPECEYEESQEFDPPLTSYRAPYRKKCLNKCGSGGGSNGCESDPSDLSAFFKYKNAKSISLQDVELKDDLEKLHVILLEDHCRNVRVGETATITGDMHVMLSSGSSSGGNVAANAGKKLFSVMYATHIKYEREEEKPITEKDISKFKEFAKQPNLIERLVEMFAPNVIGHSDAKLGILRSAVSVRDNKHITGIRSRTHTLLAGDPGTAKSMLAKEATKIVPNSRYVTAQHISIKSAMAIIDKELDNSKMLMLGAVPQARNGICAVNEMGSMMYEDQQHLADVLEEGRFTIDKHGIYQEIDSPTTIIATTNPHGGYWERSIAPSLDQLPIKSNILDRFDQVYIFEDFQTSEDRREYAMQKMEIYQQPEELKIDYDFLKRYLQYAATSIPEPVLTSEAATMLSDFWIKMTEDGNAANRSLDSLVRMARCQARLHLKEQIDTQITNEVTKDIGLMFVKMGKRIDPSVADPRDLTYNEVIQYVNTLEDPISFIEAVKHVCDNNNSIKQYLLGRGGKLWAVNSNKKLRSIHDRFTDGGMDKPKIGRGRLAVAIVGINPLTLVKSDRQEQEEKDVDMPPPTPSSQGPQGHKSHGSLESLTHHNEEIEETNDKNNSSVSDLSGDGSIGDNITAIVDKCMLDDHGNNQGYFTMDRWKTRLMLLPIQHPLHCDEDQAEQMLYAMLEKGKIREIEPGKFAMLAPPPPTPTPTSSPAPPRRT